MGPAATRSYSDSPEPHHYLHSHSKHTDTDTQQNKMENRYNSSGENAKMDGSGQDQPQSELKPETNPRTSPVAPLSQSKPAECHFESRPQVQDHHIDNCDRNGEQLIDNKEANKTNDTTVLHEGQCSSSPPIGADGLKNEQQFKLPIAKDSPATASSQGLIHDCTNLPKPLTVTRHHSTIEMPTSFETKPRAPKRKTSVFSHSGFMGIHKLDQATIQQHPIVANCSTDNQNVQMNDHQVENKSQQPQQNTSPRRSNRSDTLGSTGSSRASSCDEPTIVSPTKLFAPTQTQQQQQKSLDLKQTTSTNLMSKSSSPNSTHNPPFASKVPPEDATKAKQAENDEFQADQAGGGKSALSRDESSNDDEEERDKDDDEDDSDDEDVVFMTQKNLEAKQKKIPPFESIKTKLTRNSVPNAQDITRHIENLISRNEEIMENWNQVSIRSYNTSSQSASTAGANNRRPSKRWSTTSIDKTIASAERKCSYNPPTRRMQTFPVQKQQVPLDHRATIGQHSACSNFELIPPSVSISMPTSPKHSTNPTQDQFGGRDLPMDQNLHQPPLSSLTGHRPSQSIENGISNLSLKKQDDDMMLQDPLSQFRQRDDIVMAAILAERQRQQQLLEDYLRAGGHASAPSNDQHFHPDQILNHFQNQLQQHQQQHQLQQHHHQQQVQQHLIEQQLALSRLAAIENKYQQQQRQQAAASLMASSGQQLSPSSQQLLLQFNCLTANQALENQLLNDYISKMVLSRDEIYKSQSRELANSSRDTIPQHQSKQPSPTSPSRLYLGHGTEMLTQSLDSATPSHRCEACDISFWTRDLLNYHTMTSCSARRGPGPAKPIAFNFNHPNGYDAAPPPSQVQQSLIGSINNTSLQSPTVIVSHAPENYSGPSTCHTVHEHLQSKSVSPTRRRTYNELDSNPTQDILSQTRRPKRQSTSSIFNQHYNHEFQRDLSAPNGGDGLMPPRSPHSAREPVDFALQKRLDPALSSVLNQHKQHVTINGEESNLPIKKRKISEPNMRY